MIIPSSGASRNDDSFDDEEYVQQLMEKSRPKEYRRHHDVKIPIAEIRRLLQYHEVNNNTDDDDDDDELEGGGGVAYMRARMENKVSCPLCSEFQHWNRQLLLEHLRAHPEIEGFLENVTEEGRRYDSLLERRETIREEIEKAKSELQTVESRIRKTDRNAMAKRQEQRHALFKVLYGGGSWE